MHPEHAPSPEHPDERRGTGQPGREPSRPQPDAPAPTSPEEREALHTGGVDPPVDRSMLDALGVDAESAVADASVGRDDVTNSDASAPGNGPPRATGDAPTPPAKARGKPKKKRRKRRPPIDCRTWIPDPPIPLDTVARSL